MKPGHEYHLSELQVALDPTSPRHILPPRLAPSSKVLDIGCGAGQSLIAAYPDHVSQGLDIDFDALQLGRSLTGCVRFTQGRAEALPSLRGVETGDEGAPKLFDERRSGRRMTRNLELRLKAGESGGDYHAATVTSYGEINCASFALPEFAGAQQGTVGVIRDVTLRKEHEEALESALAAKDLLLKEIHHRVKNNLQVVSSLLNLQETAILDDEARKVFVECQTQIQTMSMVHEVLYRSSSFEGVEMDSYFERLVDYLSSVYEAGFRGVSCAIEAHGVRLDLDDAIPIALIVNELVSNCMKHAFPDGRGGNIRVSLREDGEARLLEVEDDGIGLESRDEAGISPDASGIGTELVLALAAQVRGKATHAAGRNGIGTLVAVTFPK